MEKITCLITPFLLLMSSMGCVHNVATLSTETQTGGEVWQLAFSPNGKMLIAAAEFIRMWDVPSWKYLGTMDIEPTYPHKLAFSHDGKLLACAERSKTGVLTILLFDVSAKKIREEINPQVLSIHSIAFSPDGSLLAIGTNKHVVLWDIIKEKVFKKLQFGENNSYNVRSIAFSPDGKLLVAGGETPYSFTDNVKLWGVTSGRCEASWRADKRYVRSVAFSPDDKYIASAGMDSVKLWDVKTYELVAQLKGFNRWMEGLSFSPDGKLLACGGVDWGLFGTGLFGGDRVCIWDVVSRRCIAVLKGHKDFVVTTAFSPDGKYLASGSFDKTIRIWKLK